ncbi:unnamed protein product, partial [Polarella glacialis]
AQAMGNRAGREAESNSPSQDEKKKAAFRACLLEDCVPQVRAVVQSRSFSQTTQRFGMVQAGGTGQTRVDPIGGLAARNANVAEDGLLRCEQQCAKLHWPAVLTKPWLGSVAIEMAGYPADQNQGFRDRVGPN